ncbi:hypothetical protein TNCT6_18370 [Streptomyces sp. 6-11-2]|nr:hypothetical protein TNCT6_18370 [Streptomyces sp. 6-11-2]
MIRSPSNTSAVLEAHGQVFTDANVSLPLDGMLDAILDPLIEFNLRNPAFLALIHGPDAPGEIASDKEVLHAILQRQVEETVALRAPGLPHDECVRRDHGLRRLPGGALPGDAAPGARKGRLHGRGEGGPGPVPGPGDRHGGPRGTSLRQRRGR